MVAGSEVGDGADIQELALVTAIVCPALLVGVRRFL